jgi:hypothetical protein
MKNSNPAVIDWLNVIAAGCIVVSLLVGAAALGLFPFQQRLRLSAAIDRIDKIEAKLANHDQRLQSAGLIPRTLAALDRKVSDLDTRVRYPRYARHYDGCPQCRGDVPNEEGGPPSLCEEGFEVWKSDMRAEKERRSPAPEKPADEGATR